MTNALNPISNKIQIMIEVDPTIEYEEKELKAIEKHMEKFLLNQPAFQRFTGIIFSRFSSYNTIKDFSPEVMVKTEYGYEESLIIKEMYKFRLMKEYPAYDALSDNQLEALRVAKAYSRKHYADEHGGEYPVLIIIPNGKSIISQSKYANKALSWVYIVNDYVDDEMMPLDVYLSDKRDIVAPWIQQYLLDKDQIDFIKKLPVSADKAADKMKYLNKAERDLDTHIYNLRYSADHDVICEKVPHLTRERFQDSDKTAYSNSYFKELDIRGYKDKAAYKTHVGEIGKQQRATEAVPHYSGKSGTGFFSKYDIKAQSKQIDATTRYILGQYFERPQYICDRTDTEITFAYESYGATKTFKLSKIPAAFQTSGEKIMDYVRYNPMFIKRWDSPLDGDMFHRIGCMSCPNPECDNIQLVSKYGPTECESCGAMINAEYMLVDKRAWNFDDKFQVWFRNLDYEGEDLTSSAFGSEEIEFTSYEAFADDVAADEDQTATEIWNIPADAYEHMFIRRKPDRTLIKRGQKNILLIDRYFF